MKQNTREALDAYYHEAGSWAEDRIDAAQASRRTAWTIAWILAAIAVMEAIALIMLMPLKTVEPYTLMVDRNTGFVQALKPLDANQIAPDTALTQSFLVQYVIARESFDIDLLQENYRKVQLWSVNPARAQYVASVQASNPDSPLARLPRSTVIETHVKSVSGLANGKSLVRFETVRRDRQGRAQVAQAWVAVVSYRFSNDPLTRQDRFLNPLGFQVVRYRRDAETLPADPTIVAAPATAGEAISPVDPSGQPVLPPAPARPTEQKKYLPDGSELTL